MSDEVEAAKEIVRAFQLITGEIIIATSGTEDIHLSVLMLKDAMKFELTPAPPGPNGEPRVGLNMFSVIPGCKQLGRTIKILTSNILFEFDPCDMSKEILERYTKMVSPVVVPDKTLVFPNFLSKKG